MVEVRRKDIPLGNADRPLPKGVLDLLREFQERFRGNPMDGCPSWEIGPSNITNWNVEVFGVYKSLSDHPQGVILMSTMRFSARKH
jgi:hypothetical protein